LAACTPPGGGRNKLTGRFLRHFHVICLPNPSESTLRQMFLALIAGFLADFPEHVQVFLFLLYINLLFTHALLSSLHARWSMQVWKCIYA
jgi:P-loop containing dynein motor region